MVLGDFNAKNKLWVDHNKTSYEGSTLNDLIGQYGLTQIIHEPTHILKYSVSCIDLVFTQGRSEGTSSVTLKVPIINYQIDFIKLLIFNCLTLKINLFMFNYLTSNFYFPKHISFASRRKQKTKKVKENGCLWTRVLIFGF